MTDAQAEELLALVRAIAKKLEARVPRDRVPPEQPVDASELVSVVRRGAGARLVPNDAAHPHERDRWDGDRPTSTTTREKFFKRKS